MRDQPSKPPLGDPGPSRVMTQSEIARQLVLTVNVGSQDIEGRFMLALAFVLNKLKDYHPDPKPLATWSIGHKAVGVIQFEIAPPRDALDPIPPQFDIEVEPNMLMGSSSVPDDKYYDDQWGLYKMSAEAAWSCAHANGTPTPVVVAVID